MHPFPFRIYFLLLCITALFMTGCAAPPAVPERQTRRPVNTPPAQDAADFLIVDCLLPGQVRKLGRMTYMTPRRPVKSTALECEIRGGEYVAYDRSSYSASLAVWQPQAESGDTTAQTYMGEIYLRGIGGPPRPDLAAEWFRQAAEQGHTRAQINLGYLYENGLGVPEDRQMARSWYQKATGAEISGLAAETESPAIDPAERQELERLRREVQQRRSENADIRKQLEEAHRNLESLRRELEERNRKIDAEKDALQQARAELTEKRRNQSAAGGAAIRQLETQLAQRESELQRQRTEMARMEDRLAGLRQASGSYQDALAEMEHMKEALDRRTEEAESLQQTLAESRRKLAEKETATAAARDRDLKRLETALARREAELEKERQAAEDLRKRITRLDAERDEYRSRLSRSRETTGASGGPVIEVLDPKPLASRGIQVVSVQREAKGRQIVGRVAAPAGLYSLTVNGASEKPEPSGMFKVWVPVAPEKETPVKIVAVDRQGKSSDLSFVISPEEAEKRADASGERGQSPLFSFGKYHALLIGNNEYRHLPKLETAVNDAQTLAEILRDRYGFETTVLLNATRFEIYTALDSFRKKVTEKENFLLYYAGHGELDRKNRRGYWLPVDATPESYVNAIPNYTITDILNNMSARQAMVIADTCYSGILTRSVVSEKRGGMSDEKRLEWLKTLAKERSRTVLSSGGLKPVLDIGSGGHSVFAGALVEILSANKDILEASRLHKQVGVLVSYASTELGLQQVPQYAASIHAGHESGDFLFVPENAENPFRASLQ